MREAHSESDIALMASSLLPRANARQPELNCNERLTRPRVCAADGRGTNIFAEGSCVTRSMTDRFNRPISADQIHQLLDMLQQSAEKHSADPNVGDLLFKARHVVRLLWRECTLHENLEETAAQTLSNVEKRLADCLGQQALTEAAKALAEVNRLKALIDNPPANLQTWDDGQQT